jgi:hypothetical protein
MAAQKYNATWVVSFLPTRIEFMVNDRDTSATIQENFRMSLDELDKSIESVEAFLASKGVKVFNYEVYNYPKKNIFNFVGKGLVL